MENALHAEHGLSEYYKRLELGDPPAVISVIAELAQGAPIRKALRQGLTQFAQDQEPSTGIAHPDWYELYSNTAGTLSLRTVEPGPLLFPEPTTLASMVVIGIVAAPLGSRMLIHALPDTADLAVFDPDICLLPPRIVECGVEPICLALGDVGMFEADGPMLALFWQAADQSPFQWVFGPDHAPRYSRSSSSASHRAAVVVSLITRFAGTRIPVGDATSALLSMTSHPLHFVRWRAVQGIGRLDPKTARDVLAKMRFDPHPHVAHAARKAYAKVSGSEVLDG